jgi:predicted nucleotidyltransferase
MDYELLLRSLSENAVDFVVVGGVAATIHGSARLTSDLDILYGRSPANLERLVTALAPLHPYLRGAPPGLPFRFDAQTLKSGLNFTFTTDAGPLDCLGEMTGVGGYDAVANRTIDVTLFGIRCRCIDLDTLLAAKRAAGRAKDLEVIAELEAIRDLNGS